MEEEARSVSQVQVDEIARIGTSSPAIMISHDEDGTETETSAEQWAYEVRSLMKQRKLLEYMRWCIVGMIITFSTLVILLVLYFSGVRFKMIDVGTLPSILFYLIPTIVWIFVPMVLFIYERPTIVGVDTIFLLLGAIPFDYYLELCLIYSYLGDLIIFVIYRKSSPRRVTWIRKTITSPTIRKVLDCIPNYLIFQFSLFPSESSTPFFGVNRMPLFSLRKMNILAYLLGLVAASVKRRAYYTFAQIVIQDPSTIIALPGVFISMQVFFTMALFFMVYRSVKPEHYGDDQEDDSEAANAGTELTEKQVVFSSGGKEEDESLEMPFLSQLGA